MLRVLLFCALAGCAAPQREVVLVEMQNATIENTPVGLNNIQPRQIWREGHRISVDCATLLAFDATSNTIRPEKVFVGDEIVIARTKWSVMRVEPGTEKTRGSVLLRALENP